MTELKFPEELAYSSDHVWVARTGDSAAIGITDFAQDQLGNLVFVELPETGDTFSAGEEFGSVESVKSVSELYCPVNCEIVEINTALEDTPETVNADPYGQGWMVKVKLTGDGENLLSRDHYLEAIGLK